MVISIFYGFAGNWFPIEIALFIIMVCFIIDQLLFAVTMARVTYLNRIADSQNDIAPTILMGQTLDHAVSMSVPFLGGILWAHYGYQWVFVAASFIALINLVTSLFIPSLDQIPSGYEKEPSS